MSKRSAILDVVFHRVVFAVIFLTYILVVIVDYIVDILPPLWGMFLIVPILFFGLIGYLVDEIR
ncbi:MAG: hypothetical protein FWG55_04760 [Candidatus Bathyarchaeota archaeon]|nr:hypothetical protein [Candidatus Termiticorpusculum sp.]